MSARVLQALIASKNESADDCLLEAMRIGSTAEQAACFDALLRRRTLHGLGGVVGQYGKLSPDLQQRIRDSLGLFHGAIRECGRSDVHAVRQNAMQLITDGRDGRLAYVLIDNLHTGDATLTHAAVKSLLSLAQWVARECERAMSLRSSHIANSPPGTVLSSRSPMVAPSGSADARESRGLPETAISMPDDRLSVPPGSAGGDAHIEIAHAAVDHTMGPSHELTASAPGGTTASAQAIIDAVKYRGEIESAVARALDLLRDAAEVNDLVRAAVLLCDWPGSKTLAMLHTTKHGGQSAMVRRLQQTPTAEGVPAFLLGASHGQLRSHFHVAFSRISEAPVLDAMLRRTVWLKDNHLAVCMHHVTRGTWMTEADLAHDIERRPAGEAALIGEWIAATNTPDTTQDDRLEQLRLHAKDDFEARLRLLRIAARRKKGSSTKLFAHFLDDSDERIVRLATRELIRRRPADMENLLLQKLTTATDSVRRVISRSIGQAGFDLFWARFDRLERSTRKQSGKAMLKLLPDATARLTRRLTGGVLEDQLKALQMVQEFDLAAQMQQYLIALCSHASSKVRSKAVHVVGTIKSLPPDVLVERLVTDPDPRVRANTIEILEAQHRTKFLPVLLQRARSSSGRERANAIKAMHRMKVSTASSQLGVMLGDQRPEHRISALWALKQAHLFQLVNQAVRMAKEDGNLKVRRYALGVVKNILEQAQQPAKPAALKAAS